MGHDGQSYSSAEVFGAILVRFEDNDGAGIGPFGPYSHIHFADAVMRDNDWVIAAYTDQTLLWQHMSVANWWPALTLMSPTS